MGSELRAFLCELAEEEGLSTTVNESLKGGLMAGVGAVVGGLLGGPVGMFAGGTLMSGVACSRCKHFEPLPRVLAAMPEARWRRLEERATRLARGRGLADVLGLVVAAASGTALRQELVHLVIEFAKSEFGNTIRN